MVMEGPLAAKRFSEVIPSKAPPQEKRQFRLSALMRNEHGRKRAGGAVNPAGSR